MIIATILIILLFIAGLIICIRSKESLDDRKEKLIALGISIFVTVLLLVLLINIADQPELYFIEYI